MAVWGGGHRKRRGSEWKRKCFKIMFNYVANINSRSNYKRRQGTRVRGRFGLWSEATFRIEIPRPSDEGKSGILSNVWGARKKFSINQITHNPSETKVTIVASHDPRRPHQKNTSTPFITVTFTFLSPQIIFLSVFLYVSHYLEIKFLLLSLRLRQQKKLLPLRNVKRRR